MNANTNNSMPNYQLTNKAIEEKVMQRIERMKLDREALYRKMFNIKNQDQ